MSYPTEPTHVSRQHCPRSPSPRDPHRLFSRPPFNNVCSNAMHVHTHTYTYTNTGTNITPKPARSPPLPSRVGHLKRPPIAHLEYERPPLQSIQPPADRRECTKHSQRTIPPPRQISPDKAQGKGPGGGGGQEQELLVGQQRNGTYSHAGGPKEGTFGKSCTHAWVHAGGGGKAGTKDNETSAKKDLDAFSRPIHRVPSRAILMSVTTPRGTCTGGKRAIDKREVLTCAPSLHGADKHSTVLLCSRSEPHTYTRRRHSHRSQV